MKKLLPIVALAAVLLACNDTTTESTATNSDSAATVDTAATAPVVEDTTVAAPASTTMKDGLMTLKDGKMMIVKNGAWEPMTKAVTCTNGRKVSIDGEVSKGDKKRKLTEGMMIDKDGQMMDKDGKMMDTSGWE
jgi:hypothetical protein